MELNITELDSDSYLNETIQNSLENSKPIKVIKKGVHFQEPLKPMIQVVPKQHAKLVRQQPAIVKPKISYEDILTKMGMFVDGGKLHLIDNENTIKKINNVIPEQPTKINNIPNININQNSYIYNKYFKEQIPNNDNIQKPLSVTEYKELLIKNILQKEKLRRIKSKKLIMPTSNINIAGSHANLNKLFQFSQR